MGRRKWIQQAAEVDPAPAPLSEALDEGQGPFRGFLMIECEECRAVKAFCAKRELYAFRCDKCGHETPLENLLPMFMRCKCGRQFRYKTNLTAPEFSHNCLDCESPVDMRLNRRRTAYVTI